MPMFTREDLYSSNNIPKTRELFCQAPPFNGPLTLQKENHDGKISLYKLYMNFCVEDPSEVTFAEEVFGDYYWWTRAQDVYVLRPHIEEWRAIASEKRKAIAFKTIIEEVKNAKKEGKSALAAAKYLIEEPWKHGSSVAEKKKIRKQIADTAEAAFHSKEISNDISRLKEEGILQ